MKEYTSLYRILGVSETAKDCEIKKVYRRLSLEFHPDRNLNNPSSEEKIRQINRAYAVLGDSKKRKQYDRIYSTQHKIKLEQSFRSRYISFLDLQGFSKPRFNQDKISRSQTIRKMKSDVMAEEFYNRGLAYYLIKAYEKAKVDYRQALIIAPNFGKAYLDLGRVYYELGEISDAVRNFIMAKKIFLKNNDVKKLKETLSLLNKIHPNWISKNSNNG